MQVYLGNRRVGEARLPSPRPGQHKTIVTILEDDPIDLYKPGRTPADNLSLMQTVRTRQLALKVDRVPFAVDDATLATHGQDYVWEIYRQHGVHPNEVESYKDHAGFRTIYSFKVLQVTKDQLEEIFDFDWFEPAETGGPDREYQERRREMMMNSQIGI
jgi:hypothetical protein